MLSVSQAWSRALPIDLMCPPMNWKVSVSVVTSFGSYKKLVVLLPHWDMKHSSQHLYSWATTSHFGSGINSFISFEVRPELSIFLPGHILHLTFRIWLRDWVHAAPKENTLRIEFSRQPKRWVLFKSHHLAFWTSRNSSHPAGTLWYKDSACHIFPPGLHSNINFPCCISEKSA